MLVTILAVVAGLAAAWGIMHWVWDVAARMDRAEERLLRLQRQMHLEDEAVRTQAMATTPPHPP